MLLLVQRLALGHERSILFPRFVVSQEGVNALANIAHSRLGQNGGAKFACLFNNQIGFSVGQHNYSWETLFGVRVTLEHKLGGDANELCPS